MTLPQLNQRIRSILLIAALGLFVSSAASAFASVCTLADNIRSANTNTAVGFCPAGTSHDVITIAEDITLTEPLPPITGTITIEGGGHTISGDGQFRIFDVQGANFIIKNLTLRDGKAEFGGAIQLRGGAKVTIYQSTLANNSAVYGGAIAHKGGQPNRLAIDASSFLGNRADRHAGAIDIVGGTVSIQNSSFQENHSEDYGGVIANASNSRTRIENSTFYKNSAKHDAGVLQVFSGDISLLHVTMVNNFLTAPYSNAGNTITKQTFSPGDGKVSLRNSIVAGRGGEDCFGGLDQYSGNLSRDGSCGFERSDAPRLGDLTGSPAYLPLLDQSPAVDTADPEFCLETDQIGTARPHGGGCDIGAIESTTAMPAPTPAPTICTLQDQIVAANTDRAYRACPAGNGADTIYMVRDYVLSEPLEEIKTDITIEGNGHTIDGNSRYGIFDVDGGKLTINNVTLTRGRGSRFGGAISLQNGGTAIANNVSFIRNRASEGGAIGSFFPVYIEANNSKFIENSAGTRGGAIGMNGGGFARITNSSFVGNKSSSDGGAIGSFSGGLAVSNSTFIDNSAARKGGALSVDGAGWAENIPVARLTHVTMLDNHARTGMAIWIAPINSKEDITLRLRNSIIAGPDRETLAQCVGRLSQNLYNLIQDSSCSPMLSGDPMFEEAAEGATIVALSAGSPAIDAGHPEVCPEADQIGRPRPLGNGCDLGAIETMPVVEALSDCRVTPTHNLNFRDGPWGNIIGTASYSTTFVARARTPAWFQVEREEDGTTGWISALYVHTEGDCG
ncbi:MAG: hypothetical protein OXI30_15550 [Chloroflexota bacterium]|nr:hypothetical protein [Chloroflexota bacterium]